MHEEQVQSILGGVLRHLTLFNDDRVAAHTDTSDFTIEQIMQSDKPTSVYLALPPPDIERTRRLFRLVISVIVKRLTETINNPNNRYPLLILFDEFPAFGRIDFIESALSYIAGYGIKAMLIAQNINQVHAVYGRNTSVLDQCECKVFLTPNDLTTARIISEMLGEQTLSEDRRSYSKKHESFSESSFARPLLHVDEVMKMSFDDELIFIKGQKPTKCKRLKYYEDSTFAPLANLTTPEWKQGRPTEPVKLEKTPLIKPQALPN